MLAAHRILFFESLLLTVAFVLCAMAAGLLAGSVCHRVAWRATHGRRPLGGRLVCRVCGHELTVAESIPLIGWFKRHGACPYCGEGFGIDGPACEVIGSLLFASVVLRHGLSFETFEVLAMSCVLMVLALTALWDYRVPNACIWAAVVIRIIYLVLMVVFGEHSGSLIVSSLVGALAIGAPLGLAVFLSNAMLGREVTGMGTVKLAAVIGLYLGWQQGLFAMAMGALLIALVWAVSPAKLMEVEVEGGAHRKSPEEAAELERQARTLRPTKEEDIAEPMRLIPMAPSLAIALWIMLLLGVAPSLWNAPLL